MNEETQQLDEEALEQCQRAIGYCFRDVELLCSALVHASGTEDRLRSNERLEFLGDAVLGTIVCDMLYHLYPHFQEGELTRIKSMLVSRQTCKEMSRKLGLDRFLVVGKGLSTQQAIPSSVLADVFESLVAAIYLDGGFEAAKEFVEWVLATEVERAEQDQHGGNYKSLLQHYAQRELGVTPSYRVLEERGPDHQKSFQVAAQVGRRSFLPAWGRNKKEAEQLAALNALRALNVPLEESETAGGGG